jgi:hypothetical protein
MDSGDLNDTINVRQRKVTFLFWDPQAKPLKAKPENWKPAVFDRRYYDILAL